MPHQNKKAKQLIQTNVDKLKKTAIIKITECLSLGDFLIIGSHENLPFETPDLLPSYSLSYVLKKR